MSNVIANRSVYARYTQNTKTYNVAIASNNTDYGSVSADSITNAVNYGTSITEDATTHALTIGTDNITITVTPDSSEWDYEFDKWTYANCGEENAYQVKPGCTITANFTQTKQKYTVIWKNEKGAGKRTYQFE